MDNVDGLMLRSIAQSLESIARDYHEWVEIQKRQSTQPHKGQPKIVAVRQARYNRDEYASAESPNQEAWAEVPGFRRR